MAEKEHTLAGRFGMQHHLGGQQRTGIQAGTGAPARPCRQGQPALRVEAFAPVAGPADRYAFPSRRPRKREEGRAVSEPCHLFRLRGEQDVEAAAGGLAAARTDHRRIRHIARLGQFDRMVAGMHGRTIAPAGAHHPFGDRHHPHAQGHAAMVHQADADLLYGQDRIDAPARHHLQVADAVADHRVALSVRDAIGRRFAAARRGRHRPGTAGARILHQEPLRGWIAHRIV